MLHASTMMWLGIALIIAAGNAHAHEPTHVDLAFCKRYAGYVQAELDAYRSGDPAQVNNFQQALRHAPLASQFMSMGLGWNNSTPPWVSDVYGEAQGKCLTAIRNDMRGYVPGDPERPNIQNWSHQGEAPAAALTAPHSVAKGSGPSAPPPEDNFEGTYPGTSMGSQVKVLFRRHAAICWGGVVASVNRQGMRPAQTCVLRKDPDAYVLRFPQINGGEVRVLYSTMRPVQANEGSRP